MPCHEWFELVEQYRSAVHTYGDAVDRFRGESHSDYEGAWRQAEHARRSADRARGALLLHEQLIHGFAAQAGAHARRILRHGLRALFATQADFPAEVRIVV